MRKSVLRQSRKDSFSLALPGKIRVRFDPAVPFPKVTALVGVRESFLGLGEAAACDTTDPVNSLRKDF
jgi:hypothetical protein